MLKYVPDDLIAENDEVVSDCENCGQRDECKNCCDTHLTSDETDWVDIFGAVLDFDVLNDAIHSFETEFKNQRPYLVMSNLTLRVFEELSEPITRNEEDVACVEHNCEKSTIYGCYEGYTIVVDNDLGFGVVKVR